MEAVKHAKILEGKNDSANLFELLVKLDQKQESERIKENLKKQRETSVLGLANTLIKM
jgi:hypothetical protein